MRDTRLAVGFFRHSTGYAEVQPTVRTSAMRDILVNIRYLLKIAIGRMRNRSMKRNYEMSDRQILDHEVDLPLPESPLGLTLTHTKS